MHFIINQNKFNIYSNILSFNQYLFVYPILTPLYSFPVTKFIRIGIADKNDSPPYFDKALYETEVDENEELHHTVLTITAKDDHEGEY
uniref:Cadherin domain-containing protein n=1 Tax=Timema douglasi TaxID=61478 RepID=A0A7R8ZBD8_TIMDO|nr:unnamed protein product [Timema douglasi]